MSRQEEVAAATAAVRIVRGSPDEAEVAALVAGMVAVVSATVEEEEPLPRSAWMDRSRTMRGARAAGPLSRGPLAWRTSLR